MGATGVAQICDVVQQLRCEAGERQVKKHATGLAQNLGGTGATLRRYDSGAGLRTGTVYTDTVVRAAPERFAS